MMMRGHNEAKLKFNRKGKSLAISSRATLKWLFMSHDAAVPNSLLQLCSEPPRRAELKEKANSHV